MQEMRRSVFDIPIGFTLNSLMWQGNDLIGWASGGRRIEFTRSVPEIGFALGYCVDSAICSEDGQFTVLYERLGTKAVVLRGHQVLRELNRSYYCADAYEYPIALSRLKNGRHVIAHCPEEYNILDLEDLETGESLTPRMGQPDDYFYSRLRFSPSGERLLSCGWVWHPWNTLTVHGVPEVLESPEKLNSTSTYGLSLTSEVQSADFLDDDRLLVAFDLGEDGGEGQYTHLAVIHLPDGRQDSTVNLPRTTGTIYVIGDHVLTLYEYPRLYRIASGELIAQWPEFSTGRQTSSILISEEVPAPFAFDRRGLRFAVAQTDTVTVIELGNSSQVLDRVLSEKKCS
ncbi:hypothetical protein [Deinococcus ruber]|uniref:Uncharacterized protein n=1 Tax=Deinococcus ruber TaxID=1848197 RepID=A0A918F228_9DEIO|nr:hypothetical protein [Deinococcus ruber]GGQ97707.1 hypothetical protein GCM10008957_07750 [Deinococcus ruber]